MKPAESLSLIGALVKTPAYLLGTNGEFAIGVVVGLNPSLVLTHEVLITRRGNLTVVCRGLKDMQILGAPHVAE